MCDMLKEMSSSTREIIPLGSNECHRKPFCQMHNDIKIPLTTVTRQIKALRLEVAMTKYVVMNLPTRMAESNAPFGYIQRCVHSQQPSVKRLHLFYPLNLAAMTKLQY